MIAVGLVQTPLQLGVALLSIGLFASIYHPVGTAMIVSYADRLGREMGLNGVWGNLGVASSALVTGVIGQFFGWRWAFIVPGIVTILIGLAFMRTVVHEDRSGFKQAAAQARVAKNDMWRVFLALLIVVIAISTTFNAVTVALPKLFAERLADLTASPALLGVIAAGVYVFGAMTQYTIGKLIDRYSLKAVMLPLSFMLAPFLYLAATLRTCADPGCDRHRDGRVRPGHRQRRHGRQIHQRGMALARLCGALFPRLHRGGRLGWPGGMAVRAGRFCDHAARLRRAVPAGDRRGDHPADGDQGAGGAGELGGAQLYALQTFGYIPRPETLAVQAKPRERSEAIQSPGPSFQTIAAQVPSLAMTNSCRLTQ